MPASTASAVVVPEHQGFALIEFPLAKTATEVTRLREFRFIAERSLGQNGARVEVDRFL